MVDDQSLVEKVLDGDMRAFRLLIDQNQNLVSHMVGRLIKIEEDHEELCQDVFLKVYDKLGEFNFKSRLSTWIATIAYRMSINYLQKKRIEIAKDLDELNASELNKVINSATPESAMESQDMEKFLLIAIDHLPIHYRSVLTLYHLQERRLDEIAEIMEMPLGTVKNYLYRGRKLLKESLELHLNKESLI
ncbi:sigma-70 family RNA polymerase sigma factor [Fulvivirga sp. RKSG066]|uniref:RNA polymerase sigma factor n=1 Tax=Fulvivirga aurantia TaxID=2529383 RepID=UPI0012BC98FF|nr:sigma-70 family RNA polymerase sigma factor [Fulvivirga aurantia]MTI20381.1 sigma-70 family RNA polymerase sigma factor [Fulvivirga aurantia]